MHNVDQINLTTYSLSESTHDNEHLTTNNKQVSAKKMNKKNKI